MLLAAFKETRSFCVELLTSRDRQRCDQLAMETELANTRRKSLQKNITQQVKKKLARIDLSTTSVIVLDDPQWETGVLGLVAGQIAQEYGRPTILLTTPVEEESSKETGENDPIPNQFQTPLAKRRFMPTSLHHSDFRAIASLARGSARSVNNIDLYELVQSQAHLLHRFGGHPFAAGMSLPVENIPLFRESINQQLRQQQW